MNKSWMMGFALVVTVAANGCAGGAEVASMMPAGLTLSTVGEDMVTTAADQNLPVGSGLPSASPDQPLAPAAAPQMVDSAAAAVAHIPACALAAPSANTMATAQPLGACVRGALADADGGQYFVFNPEVGVSYTLRLAGSGDARFDLGVVTTSPSGESVCTPISAGLGATRLVANGPTEPLCTVVRSDSGAAQDFRLTLTR